MKSCQLCSCFAIEIIYMLLEYIPLFPRGISFSFTVPRVSIECGVIFSDATMPSDPTATEIAMLNDDIILAGKRLVREYMSRLSIERYSDLKSIHDIIDECWHQNSSIRGGAMTDDPIAQIITEIRLCDTQIRSETASAIDTTDSRAGSSTA